MLGWEPTLVNSQTAMIILVNNKTSYGLNILRYILIVIRLCFRADYRKFDVPRIP